jgi:flagellar biosynthesis/type III secretory pathway chaperone
MITDWEFLVQTLREEVQEHGALLNCFEEQQAAILKRNPDAVLASNETIKGQLQLIGVCRERRETLVRAAAAQSGCAEHTPLQELIDFFPETVWPLMRALIEEVNRLLLKTQRRARQNQMLLARTIEVSQELLQRLRPGTMNKTYSPKGRMKIGAAATGARCMARS